MIGIDVRDQSAVLERIYTAIMVFDLARERGVVDAG
jgi:hypothetical protein